MRQISNRICISRERFGETIFSLIKKKKNSHTVSPEYAGLQQTKYGGLTFECSCLLLQSIVYDQMEKKLSNR